jgi:hypothetical protein
MRTTSNGNIERTAYAEEERATEEEDVGALTGAAGSGGRSLNSDS